MAEAEANPSAYRAPQLRFLISLGYSFMYCFSMSMGGIWLLSDPGHRSIWHFRLSVFLEYLALVGFLSLLVALTYGSARFALRRRPVGVVWLRRVSVGLVLATILAALCGKIANRYTAPETSHEAIPLIDVWVLLFGVALALVPRLSLLAEKTLRTGAKMLSPLPLIMVVYFSLVPQADTVYQDPPEPPNRQAAAPAPVLFFVMDALDRDRMIETPDADQRWPALASLAATSTVFINAQSPAYETSKTVPSLLYQKQPEELTTMGLPDSPSWFELVARDGDVRVVQGFQLTYAKLVGDRVHWVRDRSSHYPVGEGWAWTLRSHAQLAARYSYVPILSSTEYVRRFLDDRWDIVWHQVHQDILYAIRTYGPSLVAFAHLGWPHPPFMYDRNGRISPNVELHDEEAEQYRRQLEYGDRKLGELFAALRDQGLWDVATVIVTGDHGYPTLVERDPPLFIKLPGQRARVNNDTELMTCDIVRWLHSQPEFTRLRPPRE